LAARPAATAASVGASVPDRARELEFWQHQRAAMNAMKLENDLAKAIPLFRAALALNPHHEDARYYLAHCLAEQGDVATALAELEHLQRLNPRSHRAFQQWGRLRALFAENAADLAAAERALEQAHALNPEETGALHLLGEIALLRGDLASAEARLSAVCRTNPRSVGALFLRGYRAWRQGDPAAARSFLVQARQALGPDWQPKGATSEGDVHRKQHVEATPLARFWEEWSGKPEPEASFRALEAFLATRR
jgi:tetratricopeptide (TPR) repeat protein